MSAYKSKLSKYLAPKEESTPEFVVPCEHIGCPNPALVRVADGYIHRPLCREHYDGEFQRHATAHAISLGLDTTEKKKAYCMKMLRSMGQKGGSLDWAHSLKSDYIDGKRLLPAQIAIASEALGETWNNRQCTPRATS